MANNSFPNEQVLAPIKITYINVCVRRTVINSSGFYAIYFITKVITS